MEDGLNKVFQSSGHEYRNEKPQFCGDQKFFINYILIQIVYFLMKVSKVVKGILQFLKIQEIILLIIKATIPIVKSTTFLVFTKILYIIIIEIIKLSSWSFSCSNITIGIQNLKYVITRLCEHFSSSTYLYSVCWSCWAFIPIRYENNLLFPELYFCTVTLNAFKTNFFIYSLLTFVIVNFIKYLLFFSYYLCIFLIISAGKKNKVNNFLTFSQRGDWWSVHKNNVWFIKWHCFASSFK